MEQFFKIKNDKLKEKIIKEEEYRAKITGAMLTLQKEFKIADFSFGVTSDRLIMGFASHEDSKRFESQRFKNGKFKKDSELQKRYLELVKDVGEKVDVCMYFEYDLGIYGKWSSYKFVFEDEIYFFIDHDCKVKTTEDLVEISGSEYHLAKEKKFSESIEQKLED